jgi:hypothetical protein
MGCKGLEGKMMIIEVIQRVMGLVEEVLGVLVVELKNKDI